MLDAQMCCVGRGRAFGVGIVILVIVVVNTRPAAGHVSNMAFDPRHKGIQNAFLAWRV